MHKERFERNGLIFTSTCVRCGVANQTQQVQLVLPYRAWWRANPVIKSPACTRCLVILSAEDWITLVFMLAASLATTRYLPPRLVVLMMRIHRSLYMPVPAWLVSQWFAIGVVFTVLISASWLFGHYRDSFLRRQHLKVRIIDYTNDWVEIESDDDSYFADLARRSQTFS